MVIFTYIYSQYFPDNKPIIVLTEEYLSQSFFYYKIKRILIISFLLRCRYHFSFLMLEINFMLSGISYCKDKDGKERWNYVAMMDPKLEIPFLYSVRDRINMWNIQGTKFFRMYVYNRFMMIT